MKSPRVLFLIIIAFVSTFPLKSQQQQISNETLKQWQKDNDKHVVVSPNAASLGMYGSIPVGHYTGIPNIDIPLYEIDLDGKKIPISLSYHASGIKVAQEASWVGLGWTFNIGGCITRQVKGIDDFFINKEFQNYSGYYLSGTFPNISDGTMINNSNAINTIAQYAERRVDGEPDLFLFNFGNHSGSFYFNKRGINGNTETKAKAEVISKNEYFDIIFHPTSNKWIVTDGDGYRYYFGTTEETTSLSYASTIIQSNPENLPFLNRDEAYKTSRTAWMLDSIVSPNNKKIAFNYGFEEITTVPSLFEETAILLEYFRHSGGIEQMKLPTKDTRFLYSRANIKQAVLKQVIFDEGSISLEVSERKDIKPNSSKLPSKLDKIIISNNIESIKFFNFGYKYTGDTNKTVSCRLLLDYIERDDKSKYEFVYNATKLPDKTSNMTDFWGYYSNVNPDPFLNSNNLVFTTIPSTLKYIPIRGETVFLGGSSRYPIERDMQALILNKIKYPTGGTTTFEYEGNKANQEGLRLEKMESTQVGSISIAPGNDLANNRLEADAFSIEESTTLVLQMGVYFYKNPIEILDCRFLVDRFNENSQSWELYNNPGYFGGLFGHLPNNNKNEIINKTLQLQKGKYRLRIGLNKNVNSYYYRITYTGNFQKAINYFEPGKEQPLAGLRIKKITDIDDTNSLPIIKTYKYDRNGKSSGVLQVVPEFFSRQNEERWFQQNYDLNGKPILYEEYGRYFVGRTFPHSTFRLPGSPSVIGYSYVEESISGNGKTVYEFHNDKDKIIGSQYYFPDYPTYSYRLNGKPKKTTVLNSSNDTISLTTYKYKYEELSGSMKGSQYYINRNIANYHDIYYVIVRIYDIPFGKSFLEEEITISYYPGGTSSTSKKEYTYNQQNYLVSNIKTWDSQNNMINQTIKYPVDYTNNIHLEMRQNHLVNKKIEQITEVGGREIDHLKANYGKTTFGLILPFSVQTSKGGQARTDITYDSYDSKGNILQYTTLDGVSTVYLWSYKGGYPIAEIKNATYAQVCVALGGESEVKRISNSTLLSTQDSVKINTLRTHTSLSGAFVTTYTYQPLVGMKTITNPAGVTTTYQYDIFGRLESIKDHAGKIIKSYTYRYRNQ